MPACILTDTLVKAFASVTPERCCAGCSPLAILSFSGVTDGAYWVHMDIHEGSYGARWSKDGMDAMDTLFTNTRCAPIEEIETEYPLRARRWELNDNPVGHGQFRGGKGGLREWEFLSDGYISSEADGQRHRPWGLAGGMSAHPAEIWVTDPSSGQSESLSSKLPGRSTKRGEVYRLVAGNGGGTGSPLDRDPELVLEDWLDGIITLDDAGEIYGVVIDPSSAEVLAGETDAKRQASQASPSAV
jgi:N-methylhydantoinase B